MSSIWTFLDYVSESGKNEIACWLASIDPIAKEEFQDRIRHLENMRTFPPKQVKQLRGRKYRKLMELRFKKNNIQYRPICCHGPNRGQITFLAGAIEVGGQFRPMGILDKAVERMKHIHKPGRTDEHQID